MRVNVSLVNDSMKRLNFTPAELSRRIGEANRARMMTMEQRERVHQNLMENYPDPAEARDAFERIIAGNDLVSINYLERGDDRVPLGMPRTSAPAEWARGRLWHRVPHRSGRDDHQSPRLGSYNRCSAFAC